MAEYTKIATRARAELDGSAYGRHHWRLRRTHKCEEFLRDLWRCALNASARRQRFHPKAVSWCGV